jgi:hypothetical protein
LAQSRVATNWLWFITKPHVDDVGEMMNMMETIQQGFYLEILISPFSAPIVGLDLQVMEPVKQFDPPTVVHV